LLKVLIYLLVLLRRNIIETELGVLWRGRPVSRGRLFPPKQRLGMFTGLMS